MKRDPLAYASILVLATIWGYNWVVIKIATHDADAFAICAIRSAVAAVCLFGALVVTGRSLRPTPVVPTIVLGLLQTTIFTLMQVLAVATGGAGKTAILAYTMPFWVVLMAWPVLHERVSRNGWIALTLSALGLALVVLPLDAAGGLSSKALALGGAIVWAASAVYGKLLRARHPTDLLSLTTWQMLYGTLPLIAVSALAPMRHLHLTLAFLLSMAYIALLGTALAWLLWMFLLSRLSAGAAGITSLLTPVVGVLAAWLQLGERPGTPEIVGLCCIVAALIINLAPAPSAVMRAPAAAKQSLQ